MWGKVDGSARDATRSEDETAPLGNLGMYQALRDLVACECVRQPEGSSRSVRSAGVGKDDGEGGKYHGQQSDSVIHDGGRESVECARCLWCVPRKC